MTASSGILDLLRAAGRRARSRCRGRGRRFGRPAHVAGAAAGQDVGADAADHARPSAADRWSRSRMNDGRRQGQAPSGGCGGRLSAGCVDRADYAERGARTAATGPPPRQVRRRRRIKRSVRRRPSPNLPRPYPTHAGPLRPASATPAAAGPSRAPPCSSSSWSSSSTCSASASSCRCCRCYGENYVEPLDPRRAGRRRTGVGAILGLLMASFSAMQFVFAPIWGRVSDRVGRRPILLIGLVGSVVFYALFGYASDLPAERDGGAGPDAAVRRPHRRGHRRGDHRHGPGGHRRLHHAGAAQARHGPDRRGLRHRLHLRPAGRLRRALPVPRATTASIGYAAAGLSFVALVLGVVLLPETRRFDAAPPLRARLARLPAPRACALAHAGHRRRWC